MLKILKWIGFSVLPFILLVGGTFTVLKIMKPEPEVVNVAKLHFTDKQMLKILKSDTSRTAQLVNKMRAEYDTMKLVIQKYKQSILEQKIELDSLIILLEDKKRIIAMDSTKIEEMNLTLQKDLDLEQNSKSLAKTFGTMKAKEIAPILHKLDDETIMLIYMKMNSRLQKNILLGLPEERAARLTEKYMNLAQN